MDGREERGRVLSLDRRVRHVAGAAWFVPSQTRGTGGYLVDATAGTCTCADFELRRDACKHLRAVRAVQAGAASNDAPAPTEGGRVIRKTYAQDWPHYNAAQCAEKATALRMLRGLCEGIVTPPHPGRGPKPLPLADVVFGMVAKVYSTLSGRRATTDLRASADAGHMDRAPHYNSLFGYFERPAMTPLLTALVQESAAPLAAIETRFAADSTGFGTSVYRRWYDHKYGREMKEHVWVKAHAMVGVVTNVVTAVRVTHGDAGDSPELPGLVTETRRRFAMAEVSADKAYLGHDNLAAIEDAGAVPYIPFKVNSQGEGPAAWRRMYGLFMYRSEEFLAHYHARSNVESTFSAIKRKFGGAVRSRVFAAQVNEVLCKMLAFNLSCLVHALHELGIEPTFATSPRMEVGT